MHSHFQVAAVKLGRNQAVLGVIWRRIGVEQIKTDATDLELPDFRKNIAVENPNRNQKVGAVALDFTNREMMKILVQTDRLLGPILVNLLFEIAVAVKKADGDKV